MGRAPGTPLSCLRVGRDVSLWGSPGVWGTACVGRGDELLLTSSVLSSTRPRCLCTLTVCVALWLSGLCSLADV